MDGAKGKFGVYQSEFLGTFIFLLCGIAGVAGLKLAGASLGQWEINIIWGLAVAMGVYVCGGVCGAHLSPSVTIALALFAGFDRRKVLPYILAQFLAGFCAATVAYLLYKGPFDAAIAAAGGDPAQMTALAGVFCTFPNPQITFSQAFLVELVITAILMCLIMALGDEGNTAPGARLGGLLVGLLVALIGASFGPLTGFAMNAARDFGPRLFAFFAGWGNDAMTGYPLNDKLSLPYFLVPLIAPIIGACLGAAIYKGVITRTLRRQQA
ncbi:MAG: aquaporin family protein [Candidatus Accumulibacter sp.]|jgi:glycerol uptake facilitator protein|nr:aquaporin family protein [Accumulibacter sp.]